MRRDEVTIDSSLYSVCIEYRASRNRIGGPPGLLHHPWPCGWQPLKPLRIHGNVVEDERRWRTSTETTYDHVHDLSWCAPSSLMLLLWVEGHWWASDLPSWTPWPSVSQISIMPTLATSTTYSLVSVFPHWAQWGLRIGDRRTMANPCIVACIGPLLHAPSWLFCHRFILLGPPVSFNIFQHSCRSSSTALDPGSWAP